MKKLVFLLLFVFAYAAFAQKNAPKNTKVAKNSKSTLTDIKGTFKDSRDKKKYKTVKLGDNVWMAEDLNYKGKLYDFESVKNACPAGWRLPSTSTWEDLRKELSAADAKLKSQIGWPTQGKWWAATDIGPDTTVYYSVINSGFKGINKLDNSSSASFSVRCVQNIKAKPSEKKNNIKLYKTVKIGGQTWMAENLNYKTGKSWCLENDDFYCNKYGRLYDWNTAAKACPGGWHLATRREWNELTQNADILDSATGFFAMLGGNLGNEFSHAVPASEYKFLNKEKSGNWWNAPEYGSDDAYSRHIKAGENNVKEEVSNKSLGFSVRCVQNIQTKTAKTNDIKGYKTVKVGKQTWMAENFNYKTGKSWCFEDDDFYCNKYGRLYDWNTATKICPAGWHLPSDNDWNELQKSAGKNIANAISALQGGWRDNTDDKAGRWRPGENSAWWTATLYEAAVFDATDVVEARQLSSSEGIGSTRRKKSDGLYVRCIQDPPVKKISRIFTDPRDNGRYNVIKLGKIMWQKDNLNYNAKGSICYDNKPENCNKYGRLYDWDLAQTVCPAGWRLPKNEDWLDLIENSGGNVAGKKLKSKEDWNGTDNYGFSALPGGFTKAQGFAENGERGYWWTSDTYGPFGKYSYISSNRDDVVHSEGSKSMAISVRCVMDCESFSTCVME
ncbi:MAG: hypothetical protein LBQ87_09010 [Candidatus Fibromonas sp.]|jgi:uncharacterized protein (TIGR02145 family)|nr:hypothetical protein [Candidatus Fibromonas sp.]